MNGAVILGWIIANKEWFFGGAGIAIPLAILGWVFFNNKAGQKQRSGRGSVNIQVGGNLRIGKDKDDG